MSNTEERSIHTKPDTPTGNTEPVDITNPDTPTGNAESDSDGESQASNTEEYQTVNADLKLIHFYNKRRFNSDTPPMLP